MADGNKRIAKLQDNFTKNQNQINAQYSLCRSIVQ